MKKTGADLFFKLEGENISSRSFKKAIDSFLGYIENLSSQLREEKRLNWIISVEPGSICFKLHPDSHVPAIISSVQNGIRQIAQKDERPAYYSNEILTHLKTLTRLTKWKISGIKRIAIISNGTEQEMTKTMATNIESILKVQREEYGSFEGTLKIISAVAGLHFQLYEFVHGRAIRCWMDEQLTQKALKAFNKRVYVFGLIQYSKGGIPGSIKVEDLRELKEEKDLPSANDVLGILKDLS